MIRIPNFADDQCCWWCNDLLPSKRMKFCDSDCQKAYHKYWRTSEQRLKVFIRDGFVCRICGLYPAKDNGYMELPDVKKLHCDHIVPKALGGSNSMDNLQTLCAKCNTRKGKNINYGMGSRSSYRVRNRRKNYTYNELG